MKRSKFLKYLNQHNCILYREGRKHPVFINLTTGKRTTIPRHTEIDDDFCKDICKQLGVPPIN